MDFESVFNTSGEDLRIAVVGDCILDEHVFCEVLGISPEDDLAPKLRVRKRRFSLGGAANVAANLKTMGVGKVFLLGQMDNVCDLQHTSFLNSTFHALCADKDIIALMVQNGVDIPTKTRYVTDHGRHVCRVDHERPERLGVEKVEEVLANLDANGPFPFIVVSDYAKGMINNELMEGLQSRGKLIVDPKFRRIEGYGKPYVVTPNFREWMEFEYSVPDNVDFTVVTIGEKGCLVFTQSDKLTFGVRSREVGDPTGCGDSFVAGLARALLAGVRMPDACRFANAAGACAFDYTGVHAVTLSEVRHELGTFAY